MMKILILGGNGFIGKNLAKHLMNSYEVISFDKEIPSNIDNKKIIYIKGDFFNDEDILPYLIECNIVIHAVSTINPGNSNEKYFLGYKMDFLQSIKLCEWSKQYNFRIIFLSSGGTVYGYKNIMPIKEEDLPVPINHYGNLKLCIENTIRTFNRQMGLHNTIARIANPYGPGQDYRRGVGFIDAALKRAINKQTIEIWGDGFVVRDYIYIQDVCKMLGALIEYDGSREIFNISSQKGVSQNEIIKILHQLVPDIRVEYLPSRTVDVPQIVLDNTNIMKIAKCNCRTIETGINEYYRFLKRIMDEKQMH